MVSTRTEGVVAATAKATAVDRNCGIGGLVLCHSYSATVVLAHLLLLN